MLALIIANYFCELSFWGTELDYLSMWLGLPGLDPSFTIHHVTLIDSCNLDDIYGNSNFTLTYV